MPLKRRKLDTEATGSNERTKEEDENDSQEHRSSWLSKKKRHFSKAFIVISDSDEEQTQKEKMEEQKRKAKQSVLRKLEEKRRIAQMTEEEQLELAVRMSEQEASQVTYQRDEEDKLLKKALAESLNRKSSSKDTRRRSAASKLACKDHAQLSLQEEDEDSGSSVATCPDSLPPSQPASPPPGSKTPLKPVSDIICMAFLRTLNTASEPGSCSQSPIRSPASQSRVVSCSGSPVSTPASKLPNSTSIASPVNKSISRLQNDVSDTLCASNSDLQPLSEASSLSPMTKCTSQPLSGVSVILSPITRGSRAAGDATCLSSPTRKSASQPLPSASCLSPVKKSASQPLDDRQSCSPISASVPDSTHIYDKSPLVVLERLSQELLESSSVVFSPAGKVTCSDISQNPASPALTDSSDFVPTTPLKHPFAMSPTFPKVSPSIRQMAPRRLMSSLAKNEEAVEKDLEKVPSDCAESAMRESTSGSSTPDDVMDFQDEGILGQSSAWQAQGIGCTVTDGHRHIKETPALQHLSMGASQEQCTKLEGKGTVHYYWGVPFCPKGDNPNLYTKVILCQLEVYQKSLKQAQRQLLQKRGYGPPILPIPPSLRRSDRNKGGEKDEMSQENVWDNQSSQEGPMSDKSRESSRSPAAVEHTTPMDDGPTTSYMQVSGRGSTRGYAQDTRSATDMQKRERGTMNRKEMAMTQCTEEAPDGSATNGDGIDGEPMEDSQSASDLSGGGVQETPGAGGTPEQKEEVVTVCPETQASLSSEAEPDTRTLPLSGSNSPIQSAPSVTPEEIESNDHTRVDMQPTMIEGQSTIVDLDSVPQVTPNMDDIQCPLCGLGFASEQIERHAADCNGSAEKKAKRQETPVRTRRRKGMQSTALDVEELFSSPDTGKKHPLVENSPALHFPGLGKCEKCYLCKELVPLRLYQGHVDSCLQTAVLETEGSRRLRSTKADGRSEGRLLSMLDQSETMSADAERRTSAPRPGHLRSHEANKEDELEGYSLKEPSSPDDFTTHVQFSNSPIKSFVSISEATDCLVDFKKQFTKAPGTGRGRGLSRGSGKRSRWRGKKR
ncbi:BRCA1-A complex subunit RAP80 isoform X3 [Pleurodeles waltl]|uniref:BRCA1-A complex subunit RAP80 isoform X3 n=1 Tax=Pleurodeles waltl TaxID=8319 RepID=UPI0037095B25